MADDLARLTVAFEAQTAKFEAGLKRMDNRLRGFETRQKKSLEAVGRAFQNLGRTVAAGFAIAVAKSTAEAAIKMQQFERALKVATGSVDGARRELQFVGKVADELGLSFESTAQGYSRLAAAARGTALEGQNARDIFIGISEASRVLGLSAEQTGGALTAIEQIISKGKVSAEELRGQLGERLPGAFQIAARSIGVTTAELDDMLKKGELAAEDLLPALAKELHNTFGPEVEGAANDAQAAINRFETAIFKLKTEIAQGGVLDAMSALARAASAVAQGIGAAFFNASPFPFEKEIQDASERIDELIQKRDRLQNQSFFSGGGSNRAIANINAEIAAQEELIRTLTRRQEIELGLGAPARRTDAAGIFGRIDASSSELTSFITAEDQKAAEAYQKALAGFTSKFETAEQAAAALRAEIERFRAVVDPLVIAQAEKEVENILTSGIEELDLERIRGMYKKIEVETKKVNEAAADLGFTFSSAFEDAIVGARGLQDVLKGLIQDIARIFVRQTITAPFGNWLSTAFSGLFGGPRADGGPIMPGRAYLVGERGPELVMPRTPGYVVPNGTGMGGASVIVNNDFRGADAGLIRRLPQFAAQIESSTVATIQKLRREGRL